MKGTVGHGEKVSILTVVLQYSDISFCSVGLRHISPNRSRNSMSGEVFHGGRCRNVVVRVWYFSVDQTKQEKCLMSTTCQLLSSED